MTDQNSNSNRHFLLQCTVEDAEMRNCTVKNAKLIDCEAEDASIEGLNIRGLIAKGVSLDGARFDRVSLKNVSIEHADCTGLVINGVDVGELLAARRRPRSSGGVGLRRPLGKRS